MAFGEPVIGTGGDKFTTLIEFHFSETSRLYQAWNWMAHLTDGDANHYGISLPPAYTEQEC